MKEQAKSKARRRINLYFGFLVSILAIAWVMRSVQGQEVFARIKEVRISFLIAAVVTTMASYLLRSWRWPFFFSGKVLSFHDSFRCLIIGFFMNNILPARMGEFVRAHLGGRAAGESRTQVLATIAGERLADGVMISALFGVLFSVGASAAEIEEGRKIFYVAYLFAAAAAGTALVLLIRHRLFEALEKLNKIIPGHLSTYTLVRVRRFIEGLEPLLRWRRLVILTIFSSAIWLVELLVYHEVALAFNQDMTIGALSLFLAAVNFSSLVPAGPGAIGVIEFFATEALVQIGVDRETALAMVVSQHLIQIGVVGVPGLHFFLTTLHGKIPEPEGDPDLEAEVETQDVVVEDAETPEHELVDSGEIALSVVIPAYNEEQRLPKTLLSVVEYLESRGRPYEVLVVDDGSGDETAAVVQKMAKLRPQVRLLTYGRNRGKGYAVRFGVLNAQGSLILFNDADGASPIEEFRRLEQAIANGADLAIGSRAMYSKETSVKTALHRKLIGRVFSAIVNFVVLPGIADTQCGFKMFKRHVAEHIFSRQKADGFSFDVELLFLARKAGFVIAEVPINWTNIPGSKVHLVRDSIRMFLDIMRFRARDWTGGYKNPVVSGFIPTTGARSEASLAE